MPDANPATGKKAAKIPFEQVRRFLVDDALPFWSTIGRWPNGCFVEHLDRRGAPVDPGFSRVRLQARQIYVFSHAQEAGLFESQALCARSVDFLIRSAWLARERGWAKRISRDGAVIDADWDLYDIAFALFALAWRYRVTSDRRLLRIALETLDFLDAKARHPLGGFGNDAAFSLPRQQNPHMHLMEAMNAWLEASGEARFRSVADELFKLLHTKFCDASGALAEYFNVDLTLLDGPRGEIVEPGHQFEWAWIIGHYGRLSGQDHREIMRRLIDSGLRHGFDETTGLTIDQVDRSGKIIAAGRRLWPQTEALKAALAGAEFLERPCNERIAKIVDATFARFLRPGPVRGAWIDHYDADWVPIVDKTPATSFYHVSLAFFELLRLREKLETVPAVRATAKSLG